MKNKLYSNIFRVAAAGFWLAAGVARGQLGVTVAVNNPTPVTNALGRNLPGNNGNPSGAARVEIRQWGGGIVKPDPDTREGNDALNPPAGEPTYMGHDVLGDNPGQFSKQFDRSELEAGPYFARVYDADAPRDAIYYADSAAFSLPADPNETTINVAFGPLRWVFTGEVDGDDDGDGIPNAMENEVTYTNPDSWDTDGDGWDDRFEVLNDQLDPQESTPILVELHAPQPESLPPLGHSVSWWTIPGVAYRLEFHPTQVDAAGGDYVDVWADPAPGAEKVEDVDWVMDESPTGFFRVKAFPYGIP
ncbi:MAG: hypothetical protein EOM72_03930 [Opitutae bacterium]|nr:hypothetical protein [Opitutae bacterium]